ncbi:MAG: hypothetical protein E7549_09270 [Ruminococcaceae bacterium]|nr:hypothetical protein [Oscillospiraceae bacterium]
MNTKQLFLAIGDLDGELIWMGRPKKQRKPLYGWMLAAAAAVVVGVLGYAGLMEWRQQQPPVVDPRPTVVTTTTAPNGTGGDENACTVHSFEYHNIDGYLLDLVSQEEMDEFTKKYRGEEMTIVAFVEYFHISREQFIAAMRWEDALGMTALHHHPYAPYTYGQFVDAIYGDDAALTAWVFNADTLQYPETEDVYLFDGVCEVHQPEYHRVNGALIEYVGEEKWNAYYAAYGDKGEEANILTFVEFCGLTREEYIHALNWEKALEHPAPLHATWEEYTCGEFVDAIFGDDPAHSERIFAYSVFPLFTSSSTASTTFDGITYTGPSTTTTVYTGPTTTTRATATTHATVD